MPKLRGFVLAAGYGTRLAPVTDHVPKPLLPLGGATLLDHAIEALQRGGVSGVAVNSHHLGEQIRAHLVQRMQRSDPADLRVYPEPEILGTGGPLAVARTFLAEGEQFVVFNADVLCDVHVADLVAAHRESGWLATLLVVDRPRINSVLVNDADEIVHIRGAGPTVPGTSLVTARGLTYSGIAVFERRFLDMVPSGFGSLITPLVQAMEREPGCVGVYHRPEIFWDDLGTLRRYLGALTREDELSWLTAGANGPLSCGRLRGHGSDRRFWRLQTADWSAIALQSDRGELQDDEFHRHLEIGAFLRKHDLGPADVLSSDAEGNTMLMEDLGDQSLHNLGPVASVYRQTVDHLLKLQACTDAARAQCPAAVDRCLDEDVLLWETTYFQERFLRDIWGLDPAELGLDALFTELARMVANQPLVLVHRDFQSQNIHVKDGTIRLVDFQGLRLGPLGYDLMSVLWDPYVALAPEVREELMTYYCDRCGHDPAQARCWLLAAGLQRLMQALGAYGFLGKTKGKTHFLDHIPAGLCNLRQILQRAQHEIMENPDAARGRLPANLEVLSDLIDTE